LYTLAALGVGAGASRCLGCVGLGGGLPFMVMWT
jgi:hypothetical protein